MAEIYLNYAECELQLGNTNEALTYINKVRTRALMPAATASDDVWSVYYYESKIELMFEGSRFFDLRRWKQMGDIYSQAHWPTGIGVYKYKDGTIIYTHNASNYMQQRHFKDPQSYWFPIPRYELNKCPNLDPAPYE